MCIKACWINTLQQVPCMQVVVDLGKFDSEEEAAAAYDRASVWCLGLTSRLNYPPEQQIGAVSPVSPPCMSLLDCMRMRKAPHSCT